MDDYFYHIWGLNCEINYHFSLFSSSFWYIFTLLYFPCIHQSSRNIYFNNIQNSFSSFFFLDVLKKLVWNPYVLKTFLSTLCGWLNDLKKWWEEEFTCITSIQADNHHDPSYLLFLPLSSFISVQLMHPHLFCLRRIQQPACLCSETSVEILKKIKSVGQKLYDFCGSISQVPNQIIIWDDLFIFGSPEISQKRPNKKWLTEVTQ